MTDSIFVGRTQELARLEGFLDAALHSRVQVVFVTGEAGNGKTTLVTAFAERMQEKQRDLVVAAGNGKSPGISCLCLLFEPVSTTGAQWISH